MGGKAKYFLRTVRANFSLLAISWFYKSKRFLKTFLPKRLLIEIKESLYIFGNRNLKCRLCNPKARAGNSLFLHFLETSLSFPCPSVSRSSQMVAPVRNYFAKKSDRFISSLNPANNSRISLSLILLVSIPSSHLFHITPPPL